MAVREVRLLARWQDRLLRLCKLIFTKTDASVYLVPYAASGRYFSGGSAFAENEMSGSFDFSQGVGSDREPKLSIHESGQVHIHAGSTRVGPLKTLPFGEYRGQHLATVCFDRFEGLATFEGTPKASGSEQDLIVPVDSGVESGRLALYLNGEKPSFAGQVACWFVVTLTRPPRPPVYLCVKALPQEPVGDPGRGGGVSVLAGWDPSLPQSAAQQYLYVRGQ